MTRFGIVSGAPDTVEWMEIEVTPVLANVLMLPPGNDYHPDVAWLFNWLAKSERTPEEFLFVVVDLREELQRTIELWVYENNLVSRDVLDDYAWEMLSDIFQSLPIDRRELAKLFNKNGKYGHFYVIKAAAEALAARCSLLNGTSVKAASLTCLKPKGPWFAPMDMLSNWIIQVIGDPTLCPDVHMRFRMLQLYTKRMVKIDYTNRKLALDSLMTACASLAVQDSGWHISVPDLIGCLMIFEEDDFGNAYLFKYEQKLTKKLRRFRNVLLNDSSQMYSMGLKVNIPPSELNGLIGIIKYISDKTKQDYQDFQDEYNVRILGSAKHSARGLLFIYRNFPRVLTDPLLLHVIIDAIIVVMEAVVMILWEVKQNVNYHVDKGCLYYFDEMLDNLCEMHGDTHEDVDYYYTDETLLGKEIMKRYRGTFLKIRNHVDKDFISSITFLHNILHEKVN